jgi:hypothetical protein
MSRWSFFSKYNKPLVDIYKDIAPSNFVLIDGGAAGQLSEPFNIIRSVLTAIRFEPRGVDKVLINNSDIYINGGLWSHDVNKILNVAFDPSTSSICPPNYEFLKYFDDNYGFPKRKTVKKIRIGLRSIDSCVKKKQIPLPNFIKLDVHSAELPALIGGKKSLKNCVGILVETWNSEVHSKQGLHYEIEEFAVKNGFEVYDSVCAARWQIKHNNQISSVDRARYIGSEILFIKKNINKNLRLQKALILSLFGFYNDAKNALGTAIQSEHKNFYQTITKVQISIKKNPMYQLKNAIKKIIYFFGR